VYSRLLRLSSHFNAAPPFTVNFATDTLAGDDADHRAVDDEDEDEDEDDDEDEDEEDEADRPTSGCAGARAN
jgi:hypothetical protein